MYVGNEEYDGNPRVLSRYLSFTCTPTCLESKISELAVGRACSWHTWEDTICYWENLGGWNHLGGDGIDRGVMLMWIWRRQVVSQWTEFNWLTLWCHAGLSWTRWWIQCSVLLDEGPRSMKLIISSPISKHTEHWPFEAWIYCDMCLKQLSAHLTVVSAQQRLVLCIDIIPVYFESTTKHKLILWAELSFFFFNVETGGTYSYDMDYGLDDPRFDF